ncbi:Inositol hexakisphosphate and diphosphoinositol-pentakisphosphate kinase [Porphyridium purpureum]|uniref:Inositol hexakisphosphate and diphosphoinositol-pentakisphosphate kinase n=1 Tax=Porphyridium purpureum TaxID=35688 RepID=A0A5J4ZB31_PORPP|nr:Inositol hexakisphosphate and diphosphoinositol-pentakisphosphate kinase [Porphyridium purpureum]|eukprot:POR0346..scf295_1
MEVFSLGICCMAKKVQSAPFQAILAFAKEDFARLQLASEVQYELNVVVFPEDVVLNEPVQQWPLCDALIAFYSAGFPLRKAIQYYELRRPASLCDLYMQLALLDRNKTYEILEGAQVPLPRRIVVMRSHPDGHLPPEQENLNLHQQGDGQKNGDEQPPCIATSTLGKVFEQNGDWISFGEEKMCKPFVEKPVDAENHDVIVYYRGGGARLLFRKKKNQCSQLDPERVYVRTDTSYVYEPFLQGDGSMDVKVYGVLCVDTPGPYLYAEMRHSPTSHCEVHRLPNGREKRVETRLSVSERAFSIRLLEAFGQFVCGFDLLRCNNGSETYVIDVNGWSFVKDNDEYYRQCALSLAKRLEHEIACRVRSWGDHSTKPQCAP